MIYDSIFVTTPSGLTTGYSIPLFSADVSGHNSQFNIILNGITSQGYKIITTDWQEGYTDSPSATSTFYKTIFLAQPWTLTSEELEGASSSQLNITNLYPNPSDGLVTVQYKFKQGNNPQQLIVYNLKGYVVYKQDITDASIENLEFNVSKWKTGEYFVTLINESIYSESFPMIVKW